MSAPRTVIFGCDHGAIELKNLLRDHVKAKPSTSVIDVGVNTPDAVDYPDIAALVCKQVLSTPGSAGIVLCGSGIGISIACNKINGIRCALCHDYYTAEMCRKHNDANVMSLGGRTTGPEVAKQMVDIYLSTCWEGESNERHANRVRKIHALESHNE